MNQEKLRVLTEFYKCLQTVSLWDKFDSFLSCGGAKFDVEWRRRAKRSIVL